MHHQVEATISTNTFQNARQISRSSHTARCAIVVFGHRLEHLFASIFSIYGFCHFVQFTNRALDATSATANTKTCGALWRLKSTTSTNSTRYDWFDDFGCANDKRFVLFRLDCGSCQSLRCNHTDSWHFFARHELFGSFIDANEGTVQ